MILINSRNKDDRGIEISHTPYLSNCKNFEISNLGQLQGHWNTVMFAVLPRAGKLSFRKHGVDLLYLRFIISSKYMVSDWGREDRWRGERIKNGIGRKEKWENKRKYVFNNMQIIKSFPFSLLLCPL